MVRPIPITIALIAFTLMQAHSIEYWVSLTDPVRGVAFSVAIEAAALWLWYLRGMVARTFSVLASVLVIGSALFQVSEPLFARMHAASAQEELITLTRAEIADHQATIRQYEQNSGERLGWLEPMEEVRADLAAARARLREELQNTVDTGMDWRTTAGIGLQALVLVVVMVAQVLAVISLRNPLPKPTEKRPVKQTRQVAAAKPKPTEKRPVKPAAVGITDPDHFDRRVEFVADAIRQMLPNFEGKQMLVAEHINIRPADISMALNHVARKANKKETVTENALQRMENALKERGYLPNVPIPAGPIQNGAPA